MIRTRNFSIVFFQSYLNSTAVVLMAIYKKTCKKNGFLNKWKFFRSQQEQKMKVAFFITETLTHGDSTKKLHQKVGQYKIPLFYSMNANGLIFYCRIENIHHFSNCNESLFGRYLHFCTFAFPCWLHGIHIFKFNAITQFMLASLIGSSGQTTTNQSMYK